MARISQSPGSLLEQLTRQIALLKKHIASFEEEPLLALDIATKVRVLCHDTKQQTSLLRTLGQIDSLRIPDTYSHKSSDNSRAPFCGLVYINLNWDGARFVPKFSRQPEGLQPNFLDFQSWWNACILRDYEGRELTRKDLILEVADTDGGAHVDTALKENYYCISRQHSLTWKFRKNNDEPFPVTGVELSSVFQIGYEIVFALDPNFIRPQIHTDGMIGEFSIHGDFGEALFGRKLPFHMIMSHTPKGMDKYSPCKCGSGNKAKFCHPEGVKVSVQTNPI